MGINRSIFDEDGLFCEPLVRLKSDGWWRFDVSFYHNVNIITSEESGTGKTLFAKALNEVKDELGVDLQVVFSENSLRDTIIGDREVVVIDDNIEFLKAINIKERVIKNKNFVLVAILRPFDLINMPCFIDAVYTVGIEKLVNEDGVGVEFIFNRYIDYISSSKNGRYGEFCIREGSNSTESDIRRVTSEELFYNIVYGRKTLGVGGRLKVLRYLKRLVNSGVSSFFLAVDSCSFGVEFIRIYNYLIGEGKLDSISLVFDLYYSFEHILLKGLFPEVYERVLREVCVRDFINGLTFERYIKSLVYGRKFIRYTINKNGLNHCLRVGCDGCNINLENEKEVEECRRLKVGSFDLEKKYLKYFNIEIR